MAKDVSAQHWIGAILDQYSAWRFLAMVAQFGLLVLVVRAYELVSPNFGNLMVLAWGGFVVNYFLPQRLRLGWFVLVSLMGLKIVAGGTVAVWVTACGLVLIGISHLPLPFWTRVAMLLAAAAGISLLRMGHLSAPVNTAAWIVLGSMFMFRTISYLYELRHQTAPFSLMQALAYFFMMPNVCFVLFPVVDYRTFANSRDRSRPDELYPRGLQWMLRGIVHLLLYRLVYQLMVIGPMETTDLLSVARFMISVYLLYLQVSGWFHLIVGLLLMYGFDLPETHHHYLLASSFTDFWRRINIYWKDFLLKVFFYPAYFRLKRLGPAWALSVATLWAFLVTWLLHSYQFFWIRGEWLLTWQDALFWGLLALLVVVNALWELRAGRRRSLTSPKLTWSSGSLVALKTIGTFTVICLLWTLWSCKSVEELAWLVGAASNAPAMQVAAVMGGLAAVGLLGVWLSNSAVFSANPAPTKFTFWRSAAKVSALGGLLLLVGQLPESSLPAAPVLKRSLLAVRSDGLNQRDLAEKRRGYYEELDVTRHDRSARFLLARSGQDPWNQLLGRVQQNTHDFLIWELKPSTKIEYEGGTITINRWGMRDREYALHKPDGVVRIALLGSSHEFGRGLSDGLAFESLVEARLNNAAAGVDPKTRYEILNFSVGGYSACQLVYVLEERALRFQPDIVAYCVNSQEENLMLGHLTGALMAGCKCPFDVVRDTFARANVDRNMPKAVAEARLQPYLRELHHWALKEFVTICRDYEIQPIFVFRPSPTATNGLERQRESDVIADLERLGDAMNVPVVDLSAAFESCEVSTITVSLWDDHTGEHGHRLLADELYRAMMSPEGRTKWGGPIAGVLRQE